MRNNIPILHKYIRYKRLSGLSKVLTFLGVVSILYFIYINSKSPINIIDFKQTENITDDNIINSEDKPNYTVKILNSTFNGVNDKLNPYQISTAKAIRTMDNNYLLEKIAAKYQINNEEELVVSAKDGILNETTQILELDNNVQFLLGGGILETPHAQLNLLDKEASSESGVVLLFKDSWLKANNFSSTNNNTLINFRGQVSTIINISDF